MDWSRVDSSGGLDACWPWTGTNVRGYGRFMVEGKWVLAHRLVASLAGLLSPEEVRRDRPGPPDRSVLHACDTPPCCNPLHLSVGSHAENMAQMAARGRVVTHPRLLTDVQCGEIRSRASAGESERRIAARYGVSRATIRQVKRGG